MCMGYFVVVAAQVAQNALCGDIHWWKLEIIISLCSHLKRGIGPFISIGVGEDVAKTLTSPSGLNKKTKKLKTTQAITVVMVFVVLVVFREAGFGHLFRWSQILVANFFASSLGHNYEGNVQKLADFVGGWTNKRLELLQNW